MAQSGDSSILVEARGLSLRRRSSDGRWIEAVDRADFVVRRRERLVLLGPAGCGKSSIAEAIAGELSPSGGELLFNPAAGGLTPAAVIQKYAKFQPALTVREIVEQPLLAAGRSSSPASREDAGEAIAKVGLSAFADAPGEALSPIDRRRAAFARALVGGAQVLIYDEPFSALDVDLLGDASTELVSLVEKLSLTLIFATRSLDKALLMGTRLLLLSPSPGRVITTLDLAGFNAGKWGSAEFEAAANEVHHRLFDEDAPWPAPKTEPAYAA